VCKLIIAAPLVFSGGSSRISLRLSPGWDHRAGIVLACGKPAEMSECPFVSSFLYSPLLSLSLLIFMSYISSAISSSSVVSYVQSIFTSVCLPSFPCVSPPHPVQPTSLPLPHLFPFIPPSVCFSYSTLLSPDINRPVQFDGFG